MSSIPSNHSQKKPALFHGLATGTINGVLVSIAVNPLAKLSTCLAVRKTSGSALALLFQQPYKGVSTAIAASVPSNMLVFGSMPIFNKLLETVLPCEDKRHPIAAGLSGAFSSLCLAPLSNAQTRIYSQDSKTINEALSRIPKGKKIRTLYRGVPMNMSARVVNWMSFDFLSRFFKSHFEKDPALSELPISSGALAGGISGILASRLSFPCALLSKVQRISDDPLPVYKAVKEIVQREGLKGLSKGFWKASAPGMFIAGSITKFVMDKSQELLG